MVIGDSSRRDKARSPAYRVGHSWRHEDRAGDSDWRLRPGECSRSTSPTKTASDEDKTAKKELVGSEMLFFHLDVYLGT
ncbi:hypothetical protein QLX08_006197 [Tetragonisca angustula]|uniref:Uncharacterized protein n=1 Tax=Tetragonisca angustula TaxID=166442 RepID=A0AAW0ZUZ2_9HYME